MEEENKRKDKRSGRIERKENAYMIEAGVVRGDERKHKSEIKANNKKNEREIKSKA